MNDKRLTRCLVVVLLCGNMRELALVPKTTVTGLTKVTTRFGCRTCWNGMREATLIPEAAGAVFAEISTRFLLELRLNFRIRCLCAIDT